MLIAGLLIVVVLFVLFASDIKEFLFTMFIIGVIGWVIYTFFFKQRSSSVASAGQRRIPMVTENEDYFY